MNRIALHQVLRRLMFHQDITTTELARRAQLPQQTLQRIISGDTQSPHRTSLQALARYFELTMEQLKGLEPISHLSDPVAEAASSWLPIPLIDWQEIPQHTSVQQHHPTILTNAKVQQHAFAVLMNDASMSPLFPQDSTLIVDPDAPLKDRCYIIAHLYQPNEIVFRWLLIDGQTHYLKPTSPDFSDALLTKIQEKDTFYGVLVQTQCNYP